MMRDAEVPRGLRLALYGACLVLIVAGLRAAAPILRPLALAAFVATVSLPALGWLRRRGVPTAIAILFIMLVNSLIVGFFGWVMLRTVSELRTQLPGYLASAQQMEQTVRAWLLERGIEIGPEHYAALAQPERLLELAAAAARNVTSLLALFLLMLLFLVFILVESVVLPRKLRLALGSGSGGVAGAAGALKQVQHYLLLKTLISAATGFLIGTGATVVGVDFALFWGFLAFLFNFIPNVGSIIAAVPSVALALLQLGPESAAALAAVYLAVNVVLGNFVDPILVGQQLRLSPIIVLVSLVFWGWTWGPIGAFLAVPLTIALRIALESTTGLAGLAALMGPVGRDRLPD